MEHKYVFLVRVSKGTMIGKAHNYDAGYYSSLVNASNRIEKIKKDHFNHHSKMTWEFNKVTNNWVGKCQCCVATYNYIWVKKIPLDEDIDTCSHY